MTAVARIRDLLANTSLPRELVDGLLEEASPSWLYGERPDLLAADLALCHPRLRNGELRALARPTTEPRLYRFTLVAQARPCLVADLARAFHAHELLMTRASFTGYAQERLVVLGATVLVPHIFSPHTCWDGVIEIIKQAGSTPPRSVLPALVSFCCASACSGTVE